MDVRVRDAALVIVGGLLLLLTVAVLVFWGQWRPEAMGDVSSRLLPAIGLASIAALCMAVAFVRMAFMVAEVKEVPRTQWFAMALAGTLGMFLSAAIPLHNIGNWLPTDPRSQPGNVLAMMFFPGSFATVFAVVGTVLLVSRTFREASASDIAAR